MTQQLSLFDNPPNIKLSRKADPVTSQVAAEETRVKLNELQRAFLQALHRLGRGTAMEVAASCEGHSTESIRKRAHELRNKGLIRVCDQRRCRVTGKQAQVYEEVR